MKEKLNNPSAFPVTAKQFFEGKKAIGMTLLDYFAAKVLQANLTNPELLETVTKERELLKGNYQDKTAQIAYKYAKAMLKERTKYL